MKCFLSVTDFVLLDVTSRPLQCLTYDSNNKGNDTSGQVSYMWKNDSLVVC